MKRRLLWVAGLLAATVILPITAQSATYFGFNIGISNSPPPRFVYRSQPSLYMVPNTGVYVVEDGYGDMDLFRYGSFYYAYDNGYWYRANSYRGPFRAVDVRYVPTQVFYVPSNHWRHYPTLACQSTALSLPLPLRPGQLEQRLPAVRRSRLALRSAQRLPVAARQWELA